MLRSRAVWFFTPSNPKITFGGMEGEPKKEMYALLPEGSYPSTIVAKPEESLDVIKGRITANGISYPFIVKPEVGWQGVLLRKIDNEAALINYHSNMFDEYIIQAFVTYPLEVSVFYIRHPEEKSGRITGFLQKIPLQVVGNGVSTLQLLAMKHPKAAKQLNELQSRHPHQWNIVLAAGEKYMLSYAANHNRGAQFIDLKEHINNDLVAVFDKISIGINDFFYGRYDIMCQSPDDLKLGKNFTILEYNGCGAEPNHFYDTGYSLIGAYAEILKHWRALYSISTHNRKLGIKPWPLMKGWRFLRQSSELLRKMKLLDSQLD